MHRLSTAGWCSPSLLRNVRHFGGKAKSSYQVRGALAQLSDVNFNEVGVESTASSSGVWYTCCRITLRYATCNEWCFGGNSPHNGVLYTAVYRACVENVARKSPRILDGNHLTDSSATLLYHEVLCCAVSIYVIKAQQ